SKWVADKLTGYNQNQNGLTAVPGFTVEGATPRNPGSGQLVMDMTIATVKSDERPDSGLDPNTDFDSLTFSFLQHDPDGKAILQALKSNPEYSWRLSQDNARAAGATRDNATGFYDPATADQGKLSSVTNRQDTLIAADGAPILDAWDRTKALGSAYPQLGGT